MKKQITTLFLMAAAMLVPPSLVSCGEDIQTPESKEKEKGNETEPRQVVFSSYDDGTRTSMDTERRFYWETGDQIWVKNGGTYIRSASNDIAEKTYKANFTFNASLTDPSGYDVFYTGQNSPEAASLTANSLHVTIATDQTPSAWNDATRIGLSGDCGTARAEKSGNDYRFKIAHKASYLIIYPYISNTYARTYSLTKVEITAANSDTIAGTYPFDTGGLDTLNVSNPSDKITLTPGTPLELGKEIDKHFFVVIQPGTHSLSITYTYHNEVNEEFTTTKTLTADRTFSAGGVTTVKHKIIPFAFFFENTYYQWDAVNWYWKGVDNYPTANGVSATGYATSTSDANNRYYHYGTSSCNQSAKSMPSYAAMTWYLQGGAYWDNTTEWTLTDNKGNTQTITCGVWIKKWEYLPSGKSTTTPIGNTAGNWTVRIAATLGKPATSVISQYFFLPALGEIGNGLFHQLGTGGYYWSRTLHGAWASEISAHDFYFYSGYVYTSAAENLSAGFVANTRPDGSDWFQ